jgi:signal transduction histidine kinase
LRYADNEAQQTLIELPLTSVAEFFAGIKQQYRVGSKVIVFDYVDGAHFHVDTFSLQRAICNLLDNAERYAKSQITVRFRQRMKCCILQLDDDGPGIPPIARQSFKQQQAFDAQRVRGDREQGFGLGLYIVRRVAMLHRGHLKLLSAPSGGARFEIVWPDAP